MRLANLILVLGLTIARCAAQFSVQVTRDVVYTSASGYPQVLDLFLPVPITSTARPMVVLVHGGGWAAGNKSDMEGWGQHLASKGYVCATVSYRFAPQHVWPSQINDVQASVRWLRKNSAVLFANPKKIGAVGFSAGGHLVQFLSLSDTLHDFDPALSGYSSRVAVAADFVGPTEFVSPTGWRPDIWSLVTDLVGEPWRPLSLKYKQVSPLAYADAGDSPLMMFYGALDDIVPIDQGRRMDAKLQALGLRHWYYEFANEGHGFSGDTLWFCAGVVDLVFTDILKRS